MDFYHNVHQVAVGQKLNPCTEPIVATLTRNTGK